MGDDGLPLQAASVKTMRKGNHNRYGKQPLLIRSGVDSTDSIVSGGPLARGGHPARGSDCRGER